MKKVSRTNLPTRTILPKTISTLPLFSGLTERDKYVLLKDGQIISCASGEHLFLDGDPVTHFYVIVSGTMQLYRETADGHEKTIDIIKAGGTMCESEIMDSLCHLHRANSIAVHDSVLMEFTMSWLKKAAREYSAIALNLLSSISQQAHMAEMEAEQQAHLPAAKLVACFLQRLCDMYNFDPAGFDLPYSKSLIASRLGIEIETLSRTLPKLKEYGILMEGKHVTIHKQHANEKFTYGTTW